MQAAIDVAGRDGLGLSAQEAEDAILETGFFTLAQAGEQTMGGSAPILDDALGAEPVSWGDDGLLVAVKFSPVQRVCRLLISSGVIPGAHPV